MNQGKLEVVKQEMSRVNINILGISELKWTRMGEFSSEKHYIYYCGLESLGSEVQTGVSVGPCSLCDLEGRIPPGVLVASGGGH